VGNAEGRPFDGSHRYEISFGTEDLPPVDAFWSITVYDEHQRLHANPIDRYVVNSRSFETLVPASDGTRTIVVQHADPGPERRPNWLPCPAEPFGLAIRTYLPRAAIRSGAWTAPAVRRIEAP
jgi:hypothetical protein